MPRKREKDEARKVKEEERIRESDKAERKSQVCCVTFSTIIYKKSMS